METYGTKEVANMLGISVGRVLRRAKNCSIVPVDYKFGKTHKFTNTDIELLKTTEPLIKPTDNIIYVIRATETYESKSNFWHKKTINKLLKRDPMWL